MARNLSPVACINGRFVGLADAMVSVLDHGYLYGDGFYDTMRVYGGTVFELTQHLRRIVRSARHMHISLPWTTSVLREWIQELVRRNAVREGSVRVTVTRGRNTFDFSGSRSPTLTIASGQLSPTDLARGTRGVSVWTLKLDRLIPEVKTIARSEFLLGSLFAAEKGVDDVIFIGRDGFVREATTSNLFLVSKGEILTPASNIMSGLTRARVIALARRLKYTVRFADIPERSLAAADEMFLTSRLAEIVPVIRLNGKSVGGGVVGKVTRALADAYKDYVQSAIHPRQPRKSAVPSSGRVSPAIRKKRNRV